MRGVVEEVEVEGGGFAAGGAGAALFRHGADGREGAADGRGVGFEVAEVVDDAGVVFDGGGLPAGDDGEVEVVGDAGVFEVVLPGVVALFAEGVEELLGGGEGAAELPFVEEFVVGGEDLFVVGEVVAVAAVHEVGLGDLVDHEGVVVGCGAAFHLAEFGEVLAVGRAIGEVGGGFVELVVPLVACALVIVPPEGEGLLVGAVNRIVPGFVPCLRGVAGWRREAVVEDYGAAGVFFVHGFEDFEDCGVVEVGADFVLQRVLDDRRVRAVGFDHLDALDEHEALGELVGFGLRLGELYAGVGDCAFSGLQWELEHRWRACLRRVRGSAGGRDGRGRGGRLPWRGCGGS